MSQYLKDQQPLAKHFGKPVVTKRTDIEIRIYKSDRKLTKATEKEGS